VKREAVQVTPISRKTPPVGGKQLRRPRKAFSRNETFGLDLDDDIEIIGFEQPTEHTPELDPGYVFPEAATRVALLGLINGDRVLITGHTGTGKTSLWEQVAARLNYSAIKISFEGGITRNDIVGEWIVKGDQMVFQEGILPFALTLPGTIIILDEWDTINPDVSFCIQRVLQRDDGKMMLLEDGGRLVKLHRDNVIVATANTIGQGDDTGLYAAGTRIQNYAQLNRFTLTIQLSWLPPSKEREMVSKKFPDMKVDEIEAFVVTVNAVRDGFTNGQLSVPLSTRDLLNWVEKYTLIGDPNISALYSFLNRMTKQDAAVAEEIIQRCFDK
jgi:cobaltochelatase CobS